MSFEIPIFRSLINVFKLKTNLNWLFVLLGSSLGVVSAFLIVNGQWQLAFVLILSLPAIVLLQKDPWLALLIWLILTPFMVTTESAESRKMYWVIHRALPPLTVGLIGLSYLLKINYRKLPKIGLAEFAMFGYLVVSWLSIYFLNNNLQATTFVLYDRVFVPICLYLIVRYAAPNEKDWQRLLLVAFFVVVTQAIFGILFWTSPSLLPSNWIGEEPRATGSLRSTGVYTITLVFSGLLVLYGAMNRKSGWIRFIFFSAFLLGMISVILSFSRGSWLSGIVVLLGLIYLYPRFMLRLILIMVIITIILSSGIIAEQISFAQERLNSTSTALSRLPVFMASYRMFEAKPLFGWGYANFDQFDRQFQERVGGLVNPGEKDHSSHNFYLSILAEQGIVGILLFLTPFILWLLRSIKILPRMPRDGLWNRNLLIMLWLVLLNMIVVNNFLNLIVVFGLGIWWITLGLIANLVTPYLKAGQVHSIRQDITSNDLIVQAGRLK